MNVTSDKLEKGQVLGTCWYRPVSAGAESNSEYKMGSIDHRHNPSSPPVLRILSPDALAKQFPPVLRNSKVHYCVFNIKSLVPICDVVSSFWVECG